MVDPRKPHGAGALRRSLLDTMGDTPLVELRRVHDDSTGRILAKLESCNPGGSKKDRVARQIVEDAVRDGRLGPCQTVIEATGGNTGIALAQVCALLRHPFIAVVSAGHPRERIATMRAFGAEVVVVPQAEGARPGEVSREDRRLVEDRARDLVAQTGAFRADSLRNPSNFRAHRLHTGPEILRQTGGQFGVFLDYVGTGGTLAGCAAAFREFDPSIRCYAVEPEGAAVLAGQELENPDHGIDGGGFGVAELPLLADHPIDGFVQVTAEEARQAALELARKEGIFSGLASGANLCAARRLLERECFGETIVMLVHDAGSRHLSTDIWRPAA